MGKGVIWSLYNVQVEKGIDSINRYSKLKSVGGLLEPAPFNTSLVQVGLRCNIKTEITECYWSIW